MNTDLRIEIMELPEATAKVILWLASRWGVNPEEAAKRMLNEEAKRLERAGAPVDTAAA